MIYIYISYIKLLFKRRWRNQASCVSERYYYIKNRNIKEGTYKGYADELKNPYMMLKDDQTEDSISDFVKAVYTDKTSGGKRKTRKYRRTNKRTRSKRRK